MKIQDMGRDERPRERLLGHGPTGLSNAELLAVLLRTGTGSHNAVDLSRRLLQEAGGSLTGLSAMTLDQMRKISGIGPLKAATILAAFELGRRFQAEDYPYERTAIRNAGMIYRLMAPRLKGLDHEQCWIVYLNRSNYVISTELVSIGGFSETTFDIKRILQHALDRKAAGLTVVHNHPSGNPRPGQEDIQATMRLQTAARILGMTVLDHVIFADSSYYSFQDELVTLLPQNGRPAEKHLPRLPKMQEP